MAQTLKLDRVRRAFGVLASMLIALAVFGAGSPAFAQVDEKKGVDQTDSIQIESVELSDPANRAQYGVQSVYVYPRNNAEGFGLGWCIDIDLNPPNTGSDYLAPAKLTHIASKDGRGTIVPFEGELRDSGIHVTKMLIKAYEDGNTTLMNKYSTALAVLLGSYSQGIQRFVYNGGNASLSLEEFRQITGFKLSGQQGVSLPSMERDSSISIPKAGEHEYITVLVEKNYDFTKIQSAPFTTTQRVVPPSQPGLDPVDPPEDPEPSNPGNPGVADVCVDNTVTGTDPSGGTVTSTAECEEFPRIGLTKIDANDKALQLDAEFNIYPANEDGSPNYDAEPIPLSASDTEEVFADLPEAGTYYLVETKAPDGYSLLLHPVKFTISIADDKSTITLDDTGGTLVTASTDGTDAMLSHIQVADVKVGTLPLTGGNGVAPYAALGVVFLAVGLVGFRRFVI